MAKDVGPLPEARLRVVRKALMMPGGADALHAHGVFDRRGAFLPLSQTHLSRNRLSGIPQIAEATQRMDGTYLYGGLARDHFGHFIVESTTRLWALDHMDTDIDGIVFARLPSKNKSILPKRMEAFFKLLCGAQTPIFVDTPTEISRLVMPTQGFGHADWITGTPEYHSFIHTRFADVPAAGQKRIYISRARYSEIGRAVNNEDEIIEMMEAAGYHIFQPEKHGVLEQAAMLKAATHIVGGDGSAFHFAPFVMRADAKAAIFLRRNRPEVLSLLSDQMQAFTGITPTLIDPRASAVVEPGVHTRIDVEKLRIALDGSGFL